MTNRLDRPHQWWRLNSTKIKVEISYSRTASTCSIILCYIYDINISSCGLTLNSQPHGFIEKYGHSMKHVLEFPACCNHRQLKGPGRQRKWKGPRSSNQHSRVRQTETPVDPVNALQNIQMVDEWRGKKWTNEWRNIMRANASTGPLNGLMSKEMMWIIWYDLHSHHISTQLKTQASFWSNVLDSALHP